MGKVRHSRPRVVLYNPRAVFYTMPLSLLAVGSALDRQEIEVVVVDARLDADAPGRVLALADGALCLGVTALTGGPLTDALQVSPERMGEEIEALWHRYRFDELAFQDETFFTYRGRVARIAEQFLERDLRFKWTATLRADQAVRLGEETFKLCVRSGLDRAMIGVESGSQAMLDWMQKDIRIEQVTLSAELCARHGVGAIFPFIVGFPDETPRSVRATLELIKRLRAMSPRFETPLFYFKPYPGSRITDEVVAAGYELPDTIEGWADFDFIGSAGPWVSPEKERLVERFKFYNRFAGGRETWPRRPLQLLARWRCRRDAYGWPWEKRLVELLRPQAELS